MSDKTSDVKHANRPAATIWDYFAFTRRVVALLCATMAVYCLSMLAFLLIGWLIVQGWDLSRIAQKFPVIVMLVFMGVEGALGFGLYRGHFGLGRTAIAVAAIATLLWLAAAAWAAYVVTDFITSDFPFPDGFSLLLGMSLSPLPLFGGMIFFVTYLLWRMNNDA